jgi:hypothetical protein
LIEIVVGGRFLTSEAPLILDPDTFRANLLKYTTLAFSVLPRLHRPNILDAGCGTFVLLGFFLLSDAVWWHEYYKPLETSLAGADSVCPPHTIDGIKKELEQFKNDPKRFQSAFFVTEKTQPMLARASQ